MVHSICTVYGFLESAGLVRHLHPQLDHAVMLIHVVHLELEQEIGFSSFKYNEDDLLEIDSMFLLNYN